jgi:hypothetical protein
MLLKRGAVRNAVAAGSRSLLRWFPVNSGILYAITFVATCLVAVVTFPADDSTLPIHV